MRLVARLATAVVRTLWVAGLTLSFTLFVGTRVYSGDLAADLSRHGAIPKFTQRVPAHGVLEVSEPHGFREHANYRMELEGSRNLNIATEVEASGSGLVQYTIRLQLDSKREQLIEVIAPPGGLEPEVRDMTGDSTRNDLLLTPALFCWPPTVLVNDEHDHFAVAISGLGRDSIASRPQLASGSGNPQGAAGLISSGFDTVRSTPDPGRFRPLRGTPLALGDTLRALNPEPASKSDRAPPSLLTSI